MKLGGVGASAVYDDRDGIVKLVVDSEYGEIVGAHIVGNRACDMIAELVDTIALEGGYQELARTIHPHPTISEAILDAARASTAGRSTSSAAEWRGRRHDLLLRPRLALRVPRRGADLGRSSRRPAPSSRSGSRSCSVACSSASAAAPGGRARTARRACARSSAAPRPTACRRSLARSVAGEHARPRCARRPSPRRSAAPSRFSLAAFRQAFAAGRDLSEPDNVCDRRGLLGASPALARDGGRPRRDQAAPARGDRPRRRPRRHRACPRWSSASEVFWGDDRLEDAARAAGISRR